MRSFLGFLVFLLLPVMAAGQSVRGTLLDRADEAPLAGALVLLLDVEGTVRAQVLSNAAGRFTIVAPVPGRYSLRVQRIGFRDVDVPDVELAAGATVERVVRMGAEPIAMAGITAQARRRCVVRPEHGLAVAMLWEEARKALSMTALTESQGRYRYTLSRYTRELDASNLRVLRETSRSDREFMEGSPFVSRPVAELLERGFVETTEAGPRYYAPDARALLSDEFLDAYCFRPAESDADQPGLVGLSFEPAERRGPAAIRGTLWLDSATYELRYLEYRYTRVEWPEGPVRHLGGRVDFDALPDGNRIVRRWRIRMPVVEERVNEWAPAGSRRRLVIARLTEQGGEVLETTDIAGQVLRSARRAVLSGVVFDSAAAAPLAGAVVRLIGTAHRATADEAGRYRLEELSPGEFLVTFTHPRLERYDLEPVALPVTITEGGADTLDLAIPAGARPAPDSVALLPLVVRLRDWESGGPVADAVVSLPELGLSAVADATGRAALPRAPAGAHRIRVEHVAYGTYEQELVLHAGATWFDVRVPAAPLRMAAIEVRARTAEAEARRTRGVSVNIMTRPDIARAAGEVRHLGDLATRFHGLTLQEGQTQTGRLITDFCIQNRRGVSVSGRNPCVVVVLDDIPIHDSSVLLSLDPDALESIEYLNALEAGPRYGTLSTAGVLLVYTRGKGPYRQPAR
ncbi:MAG TPA: carboxypeptidase regulatory-like domain-containing protein [Longimicrobiales bacterium]|nr:carboxypeptidase regulatory-like domain-containing protein [Longimicrobiales bacterium]